ncbi:MAG: hypothetical protein KKH44_07775 [Bacteroidetes bacterium]|nr:hypothetical protein [Bacteroidota bacterium]
MPELLALLPDIENFIVHDVEDEHYSSYDMPIEIADKILTDLRDATDNCPACIMAALRQKGIPIPIIPNFIYSKEVKEFWAEVNSSISMKESNYSY